MTEELSITCRTSPEYPTIAPALITDDSIAVLRFALEGMRAGLAVALVTLQDVRGGAARSPGAQMAVREDGLYCGFVSGGCVEAAAAYEAVDTLRAGQDRAVIYGEGSPWFDIVLPCKGSITLGIHILRSPLPLLAVLNALDRREPAGLRYFAASQTLQSLPPGEHADSRDGAFDIRYRPRTRVVIFGRSIEAQITGQLAEVAGYDVHIVARIDAPDQASLIDADSAVIILFHDLQRELPALRLALAATPFYIGALGSSRTHQQRVQLLTSEGYSQREIQRVKAPIGIFPKARDTRTLALSIMADVAAARIRV